MPPRPFLPVRQPNQLSVGTHLIRELYMRSQKQTSHNDSPQCLFRRQPRIDRSSCHGVSWKPIFASILLSRGLKVSRIRPRLGAFAQTNLACARFGLSRFTQVQSPLFVKRRNKPSEY